MSVDLPEVRPVKVGSLKIIDDLLRCWLIIDDGDPPLIIAGLD